MNKTFPHEIFGLSDREAAELIVHISVCAMNRKSELETINSAPEKYRNFIAYMVGYYTGLMRQMSDPQTASKESSFIAKVIYTLMHEGEHKAKDDLIRYFEYVRGRVDEYNKKNYI